MSLEMKGRRRAVERRGLPAFGLALPQLEQVLFAASVGWVYAELEHNSPPLPPKVAELVYVVATGSFPSNPALLVLKKDDRLVRCIDFLQNRMQQKGRILFGMRVGKRSRGKEVLFAMQLAGCCDSASVRARSVPTDAVQTKLFQDHRRRWYTDIQKMTKHKSIDAPSGGFI